MLKSKLILIILIGILALGSCKNYNKGTIKGIEVSEVYLLPSVNHDFKIPEPPVNYKIKNASIQDSILTLNITYSGGCKEHKFDLIFNGMYKKSLPKQGDLYLAHESNGDMCKKLIMLELKYNLAPILGLNKQATNFSLYSYPEKLKYIGKY